MSNSFLITSKFHDKVFFVKSDEPNTVLGLKWCNSRDSFSFDFQITQTRLIFSTGKRLMFNQSACFFEIDRLHAENIDAPSLT